MSDLHSTLDPRNCTTARARHPRRPLTVYSRRHDHDTVTLPRPPTTIALDRAPATGEATAAATRPLPRDKKGPIDGPRVRADSLPPIRTLARLTETLNEMTQPNQGQITVNVPVGLLKQHEWLRESAGWMDRVTRAMLERVSSEPDRRTAQDAQSRIRLYALNGIGERLQILLRIAERENERMHECGSEDVWPEVRCSGACQPH